jgi:hypothetical protein
MFDANDTPVKQKNDHTSEAACQHNSSETTEQNYMKLGS